MVTTATARARFIECGNVSTRHGDHHLHHLRCPLVHPHRSIVAALSDIYGMKNHSDLDRDLPRKL